MNKQVIATILFSKIAIFSIIIIAYSLLPFSRFTYEVNFHYPQKESLSVVNAFKTWDAQHYLYLAHEGYKQDESSRFYPLFPFLLSLGVNIFPSDVVSSLLIANILSGIGVYFFYLLACKILNDKKQAYISFLSLLFFPTAFYVSLIYSESLFLLLISGFFYFLYEKRLYIASSFAFLIPLTRPIGIFIIFPYTLFYLLYIIQFPKKWKSHVTDIIKQKHVYLLLTPFLGFFLYLLIMQITTGSYYTGFAMQSSVVGKWDILRIVRPDIFLHSFFSLPLAMHGFTNSVLDRIFFIVFLILLVPLYRKFDKVLFIYTLTVGLVPFFGSFMAYTRYVFLAIPVFLLFGKLLSGQRYGLIRDGIFYVFLSLQTLFLIMHTLNYWVA